MSLPRQPLNKDDVDALDGIINFANRSKDESGFLQQSKML